MGSPHRDRVNSPATPTRVLVVDDHEWARVRLSALLAQAAGVLVVGGCRDGAEAVARVDQQPADVIDVVLMDLNMPGMDGVTATGGLRQVLPRAHVIVVTGTTSPAGHAAALRAGACQVLAKDASAAQVLAAVHSCGAGDHPSGSAREGATRR